VPIVNPSISQTSAAGSSTQKVTMDAGK